MMVKKKREKKERGNGRLLRAMIGILLALIMLGSVIAVILQI
jgi:hypothetical protein